MKNAVGLLTASVPRPESIFRQQAGGEENVMHAMRRLGDWVLLVGMLGTADAALAQIVTVDLGTLGGFGRAVAVSNSGQAVGTSGGHAFSWTVAGGMVDLGTLGGTQSDAYAVNENGQVVGVSHYIVGVEDRHAFSWTASGGMIDLGTLGGIWSDARSVNGNGQIAGFSATANGEAHAFSWTEAGGMIDLGTLGGNYSAAMAINDNGTVVGVSTNANNVQHAFSWTAAWGMVDLGTLSGTDPLNSDLGSQGLALNNKGQVVGDSTTTNGQTHAFSWTAAGGMVDLGTLDGTFSRAAGLFFDVHTFSVNDKGQVVGWSGDRSFLWTAAGGIVDLGTLGGARNFAMAVNENGQVVGFSQGTGPSDPVHAFLWTPAEGMVDLGRNSFAYAVNDKGQVVGYSDNRATMWLTVPEELDTTPPTINGVTPSRNRLWPPNQRMVPITLDVDVSDLVTQTPTCQIATVSSNEPGPNQWTITGPLSLSVVASRTGGGSGRTYTIDVTCADAAGNLSAPRATTIVVPHDQR